MIGYCPVSTHAKKDDLENQVNNVKNYMYAKGYQFEIVTVFANRLYGSRSKKTKRLIDEVKNGNFK